MFMLSKQSWLLLDGLTLLIPFATDSYSCYFFSCSQTAGFQEILTEIEILALIVGCLCHDLDHRGTNNAFQAK